MACHQNNDQIRILQRLPHFLRPVVTRKNFFFRVPYRVAGGLEFFRQLARHRGVFARMADEDLHEPNNIGLAIWVQRSVVSDFAARSSTSSRMTAPHRCHSERERIIWSK